jgi:DNA excision repair protein ERCC-8
MNRLLFERSTGTVRPKTFARIVLSQRVQSIQLDPKLIFEGGEKEVPLDEDESESGNALSSVNAKRWAHQAGVNALGIDIEGRMLVVKFLDLDSLTN